LKAKCKKRRGICRSGAALERLANYTANETGPIRKARKVGGEIPYAE
jgi:hypothetical protein